MKTIVELNGNNYGSSGDVALNIAEEARKRGFNVYTFCKISKQSKKFKYENQIYYGKWLERIISEQLSFITGLRDHFNVFGTLDLIRKLKKIKPDLIHIHVLHDNFLNYRLLFNYFNLANIPIIWTLHDCYSLTGQCPCFDMVECNKWINGCYNCPQIHVKPKSLLFDTSKQMWAYKKNCFTNVNNLTIITPSNWLFNLVKLSFLKNYDTRVINNGIDLNKFRTINSDFRTKYNIEDKYMILGVASYWEKRKGLDIFIELAKTLPNEFQIVLVGTNDRIDSFLPANIISIHKTYNQQELAEIYSCADVFANPTREDNFPTVNIEALACGTPVITFNTGGSPEIIDKTCGSVVEKNNIDEFKKEIISVCKNKPYKKESCLSRAKHFNKRDTYNKYIDLFIEKLNI